MREACSGSLLALSALLALLAPSAGCHLLLGIDRCADNADCASGVCGDFGVCVDVGEGEGEACPPVFDGALASPIDTHSLPEGTTAVRLQLSASALSVANAAVQLILRDESDNVLRLKLLQGFVEWNDRIDGAGSRSAAPAATDTPGLVVELHTDGTALVGGEPVLVGTQIGPAVSLEIATTCDGDDCGAVADVHLQAFSVCRLGSPAPLDDDCAASASFLTGDLVGINARLNHSVGDVFDLTVNALGPGDVLVFDAVDSNFVPVVDVRVDAAAGRAFYVDAAGVRLDAQELVLPPLPFTLTFDPDASLSQNGASIDLVVDGTSISQIRVRRGSPPCGPAPCAPDVDVRLRRLAPTCVP